MVTNKLKPIYWEVVVGNIGTVYSDHSEAEARKAYLTYVMLSKDGYGRAAHESVCLLADGEPIEEYQGLMES